MGLKMLKAKAYLALKHGDLDLRLAQPLAAYIEVLEEQLAKLENDLISAPNPYSDDFQLSRYKGWYVTDRTHNLPIEKKNKKEG